MTAMLLGLAMLLGFSAQAWCSGLKFLTRSDTVYMDAVPYYNIVAFEISVESEWSIVIQACHEGAEYQDIFKHTGDGTIPVWPFSLQWNQYADIHMNVTLYELSSGKGWNTHKRFQVRFLEPVSFVLSDPLHGQHLHTLDSKDQTVIELLEWAIDELSSSRRVVWDSVVHVLLLANFALAEHCSKPTMSTSNSGSSRDETIGDSRSTKEEGKCSWSQALTEWQRREQVEEGGKGGGGEKVNLYITVDAQVFKVCLCVFECASVCVCLCCLVALSESCPAARPTYEGIMAHAFESLKLHSCKCVLSHI